RAVRYRVENLTGAATFMTAIGYLLPNDALLSSPVEGLTVVNPARFISGGLPLAHRQGLDELRGEEMIRPRILASDELAIDNHVGREINRPGDDLAASCLECVGHVEVHRGVKDVAFDPPLF